ncbi:MAG TPA: NUDIX hydrolase [Cerasibacillus sp.]|uniref:NUDIX hydrolase n=1 Tax=Cerasibacillus sp. TaxID=2498711 RepID=UPI002F40E4C3
MKTWFGAAAVCINENFEILMVKQGLPDEEKKWTIPSGGKEPDETFASCCLRELYEETGYEGVVERLLYIKTDVIEENQVEVHYYEVVITGGEKTLHDPDQHIYEIEWKSAREIQHLKLSFPKDRTFLLNYIEKKRMTTEGM